MERIVILPAAGRGARLAPFPAPKELLPVLYEVHANARRAHPILAIECSLAAARLAGIRRGLIIVSDDKTEILRYIGDGSRYGLSIAYLHQAAPTGLARAVNSAFDWCQGLSVCLSLPDTVYDPPSALSAVSDELHASHSDLVLGVFPHTAPETLGPVRLHEGGAITEVLDKPSSTSLRNTWGVAAWSPRFTEFLRDVVTSADPAVDLPLGNIFNQAIQKRLAGRAVNFAPGGTFHDLGTFTSIADFISRKT